MNLVIDVGNSLTKYAIFKDGQLQFKQSCSTSNLVNHLTEVFSGHTIKKAIVAYVGHLEHDQLEGLKRLFPVLVMDHTLQLPFQNHYATPETLGVDRMALASAAAHLFPNINVLVIDIGSCITYDFITDQSHYLGGAISPGWTMRYKALHAFTAKLPLLTPAIPNHTIGNTTEASIHSGVTLGIINEIDGFIASYKKTYNDLTVILTGGDGLFLRDRLKNDIFAHPNFLFEGLNHILEFNTH